jgi:uncharacterized protein YjbJ (UPF0337 family)
VTDNLRFVTHPAVWHNRAALASLMAESLSDVTTRRYQARLAELYKRLARYAEERIAVPQGVGYVPSEIMMDLNARRWFTSMQWDEIEHQWAELQARARRHWFHLTQEDVEQITGTREQLIERVQERYGFSREQAVKEVDAWAFFLRSDL